MTSKEFYQSVFAECNDANGVQTTFRALMSELCDACNERQVELKSGKKSTKKTTAKTETKTEVKAEPKQTAKPTTAKQNAKTTKAEPKPTKKTKETKAEAPEVEVIKINKRTISKLGLQYVDYSEKAFAIIGDTKPIKDELKSLKGRFNSRLTINGESKAGWVFAKRNSEPVLKSLYIA